MSPRLLTKKDAATYCNISLGTFDAWVSKGLLPDRLPGTKRYDRKAIDAFLDKASNLGSNDNQDASPAYLRRKQRLQNGNR